MRKIMSVLAATALIGGSCALSTQPASALGSEQLGCRVAPAAGGTPVSPGYCGNSKPGNPSYSVGFQLLNESGTYTYAWTVPAQYQSRIYSGCTATSDSCAFTASSGYSEITVSVVITQGAASETLSATADIEPFCGQVFC